MLNSLVFTIPKVSIRSSLIIFALLVIAAVAAVVVTPNFNTTQQPPVLEDVIPLTLGDWVNQPTPYAQVSVSTYTQNLTDALYDQVLMRTYKDHQGNQIMLALAYAKEQRQDIKIHQPEVCYPAQGYKIESIKNHTFSISGYSFPIYGKRLIFNKDNKMEAVSYWIRLGDGFPLTGLQMRWKILKDGLKGHLDDGMLVRVSTIINQESDADTAYKVHEKFLSDLLTLVTPKAPGILVPVP